MARKKRSDTATAFKKRLRPVRTPSRFADAMDVTPVATTEVTLASLDAKLDRLAEFVAYDDVETHPVLGSMPGRARWLEYVQHGR